MKLSAVQRDTFGKACVSLKTFIALHFDNLIYRSYNWIVQLELTNVFITLLHSLAHTLWGTVVTFQVGSSVSVSSFFWLHMASAVKKLHTDVRE